LNKIIERDNEYSITKYAHGQLKETSRRLLIEFTLKRRKE
jgi:hypothetical protein